MKREVESVQNLLQENLVKVTNVRIPQRDPKGILAEINESSVAKLKECFGDFGINLKKFVEHFNFSHPCLQETLGVFDHTTLSGRMSEMLALYDTVIENEAHGILKLYSQYLNDGNKVVNHLNRIVNDLPPIRALSDPGVRAKLRKQGRLSKNAGSLYFSEFEADAHRWYDSPNSMSYYVRFNDQTLPESEVINKKKVISRFLELGMEAQATSYNNHLNSLLSKKRSSYCGFQLVDLESMVSTLGKVHGFISDKNFVSLSANNEKLLKFLFDSVCLGPKYINEIMRTFGENWHVHDPSTLKDALDCVLSHFNWLHFFQTISKKTPLFFYRTRVYMASNNIISKLIPEEVHGIIDQLERFHDFGHLPLFDHFLVFVPSINISTVFYNEKNQGYFIHDGTGLRDFSSKSDASAFLDLLLMKKRLVSPFLVGQKDDQQYPIGYCF